MRLQSAAIWLLVAYKRWLSPILPAACRFHPSCSEYARQAISMHGLGRGSWLAIRRLVRCQPFCRGGFDPVPCASKSHSPHGRCTG